MVPTWTGKMGEHFPVGEKLENFKMFEKSEKIALKIFFKYWKSQGNLPASNSENPANMVPYFKFKKH